jgi:hypothetical protein
MVLQKLSSPSSAMGMSCSSLTSTNKSVTRLFLTRRIIAIVVETTA